MPPKDVKLHSFSVSWVGQKAGSAKVELHVDHVLASDIIAAIVQCTDKFSNVLKAERIPFIHTVTKDDQ